MTNQEFLVEYLIRDLAVYLMKDEECDMLPALRFIYNSKIYTLLMDKEIELYVESSAYVYELLKEEYRLGTLRKGDEM